MVMSFRWRRFHGYCGGRGWSRKETLGKRVDGVARHGGLCTVVGELGTRGILSALLVFMHWQNRLLLRAQIAVIGLHEIIGYVALRDSESERLCTCPGFPSFLT